MCQQRNKNQCVFNLCAVGNDCRLLPVQEGGALNQERLGTIAVTGSVISNNTAQYGAGVSGGT